MTSLVAQMVKRLPAVQEAWVWSLGQEDPLEKEMEKSTHSSTLAWKFRGLRNLVGYSPWGRKESDTTEWIHFFEKKSLPPVQCQEPVHSLISLLIFEY